MEVAGRASPARRRYFHLTGGTDYRMLSWRQLVVPTIERASPLWLAFEAVSERRAIGRTSRLGYTDFLRV